MISAQQLASDMRMRPGVGWLLCTYMARQAVVNALYFETILTNANPSCITKTRYPDVNTKDVLMSEIQFWVLVSTTAATAS